MDSQPCELGMSMDLALMKHRAETQPRHSQEEMAVILRTAMDGFWLVDMRGRFLQVNDACCRMHAYTAEEMLSLSIADLEVDESPAEIAASIERIKQSGCDRFERRHRCKDGRFIHVEVSINYLPVSGGRFFCFLRDITERKRAEAAKAQLETQNRQLQKAECLRRMAASVAHHFNNQLQVVIGNLALAMEDLPRNAGPVDNLTRAIESARKAAEVSGLMLTYLGLGRQKREPLDLSEACLQSLPMLRARIPKAVLLQTELPTPGPQIHANTNQIQQVLANLATNAWEASGDGGGIVRITVKRVSAADIATVNRFPTDWRPQQDAYACLEVADTGCGIQDKDIEAVFDPFFSTKFAGRGMGLPVVLGIARAYNGTVTLATKPGKGSTVRVFIPQSLSLLPYATGQNGLDSRLPEPIMNVSKAL